VDLHWDLGELDESAEARLRLAIHLNIHLRWPVKLAKVYMVVLMCLYLSEVYLDGELIDQDTDSSHQVCMRRGL